MGILCQCKQPIIYAKERTVIELDEGSQHPKKEYTNKSTTLKSKFLTKDTTLTSGNYKSTDSNQNALLVSGNIKANKS